MLLCIFKLSGLHRSSPLFLLSPYEYTTSLVLLASDMISGFFDIASDSSRRCRRHGLMIMVDMMDRSRSGGGWGFLARRVFGVLRARIGFWGSGSVVKRGSLWARFLLNSISAFAVKLIVQHLSGLLDCQKGLSGPLQSHDSFSKNSTMVL